MLCWHQLQILADGSVCLELFKVRGGEKCVAEVLRISPDGLNVSAVQTAEINFFYDHLLTTEIYLYYQN